MGSASVPVGRQQARFEVKHVGLNSIESGCAGGLRRASALWLRKWPCLLSMGVVFCQKRQSSRCRSATWHTVKPTTAPFLRIFCDLGPARLVLVGAFAAKIAVPGQTQAAPIRAPAPRIGCLEICKIDVEVFRLRPTSGQPSILQMLSRRRPYSEGSSTNHQNVLHGPR